ncbi:MAG: hypothetical protein LKH27_02205 [Prevotella sp.]|jgi:hypothetical protein|nr:MULTISPECIES: hypothetical protein [unclassified Prevotella]MCH3968885.1 hypothetical protein [Prevotella sp.]MCH3985260.1 hypothetical protein [Prevotella sp.]MCH3992269.1 hypothetical protein [Prevotella sp.]MCH4017146.1 hypothetical protein [Prevotella sp.]MCH4099935.1 hypothetical protein [Prevotella sp.]
MKRNIFLLAALLIMSLSAKAMGYKRAAVEARYLTDKMAYEMGLSSREYDRAYRINLNYFLGINDRNDLYASGWRTRSSAFRVFFNNRQWNLFIGTDYFYRPVSWRNGSYVYNVYSRYPRHDNGRHRGNYNSQYRGDYNDRHRGNYNGRHYGQDRKNSHDEVYGFDRQPYRKNQEKIDKRMERGNKHHEW